MSIHPVWMGTVGCKPGAFYSPLHQGALPSPQLALHQNNWALACQPGWLREETQRIFFSLSLKKCSMNPNPLRPKIGNRKWYFCVFFIQIEVFQSVTKRTSLLLWHKDMKLIKSQKSARGDVNTQELNCRKFLLAQQNISSSSSPPSSLSSFYSRTETVHKKKKKIYSLFPHSCQQEKVLDYRAVSAWRHQYSPGSQSRLEARNPEYACAFIRYFCTWSNSKLTVWCLKCRRSHSVNMMKPSDVTFIRAAFKSVNLQILFP